MGSGFRRTAKVDELVHTLKERESQGYQFEGAEGSFELLMRKAMGSHKSSFRLLGFRVIVEKKQEDGSPRFRRRR